MYCRVYNIHASWHCVHAVKTLGISEELTDKGYGHRQMDFINIIVMMATVLVCSTALTYGARYYALRHNILDHPNDRSSHITPTPRGGGIAIVVTFTLATLLYLWLQQSTDVALVCALTLGGIIIAILGYCDDIYRIKPRTRVIIHFAIASFALYLLNGLPILDFGTWQFHLHGLGTLIGIISIVWLTNLYNFMDGIDGLACSEGLFVSLAAGLILWFTAHDDIAMLFFLLAASIGGFTLLNWPPAKIFLGDVGSGYLGYIIAVLGIYSSKQTALSISFWLILLAVFICDATFTVIQRTLNGKPWYIAHREHAYQRLIAAGATHRQITLAILCLNIAMLLPCALITMYWPLYGGWTMMAAVVSLYLLWRKIIKRTALA